MTLHDDPSRRYADIVDRAKAVVDAVTRDDCGQMVGQVWQGGNGGLLSRETLVAVDRLRNALLLNDRYDATNAIAKAKKDRT